jgi:hypothetical protein
MNTINRVALGWVTIATFMAAVACKPIEPDGAGGGSTQGMGGAGGAPGVGGAGGNGGQPIGTASLAFTGEGAKAIPLDSAYKPLNIDGIPPFSTASLRILVGNVGMSEVTVDTIQITPEGGTLTDEWRVSEPGSTGGNPFSLDGVKIAPGEQAEFGLFFWAFASGPRAARVDVKLTDGTAAGFIIDGRGRDNLAFSPKITQTYERVWSGTDKAQIATGGVVSDGAGGIVYNANVRELLDIFSRDLALSHVNADGTQAWAKVWNEQYLQESPAPDQNNETGGGADAIAHGGDGHVYVAGSRSVTNANSIPGSFQALVYKANVSTGALAWARGLRNSTFASPNDGDNVTWRGAMGFAVDATLPDRVIAVGYTGSPSVILLFALSKTDGSLIYSRRININADGAADRAFTVRVDANGDGYIGGDQAGRALLVRLTDLDTPSPALAWAREVVPSIGTQINSIVIADNGDAITSVFIGGAERDFVVARVSTAGAKVWAKSWDSKNFGPNNTARVVRTRGGTTFVGGNIALETADPSRGDGFVMALDSATGAYKFGSLYYSGKTITTITQHLVKGFAFTGDDVFSLIDGTPGSGNTDHYWGFWYQAPDDKLELPAGDGAARLVDYDAVAPAPVASADLTYLQKDNGDTGGVHEGTAHVIDTTAIWVDAPAGLVTFTDARGYAQAPKNHVLVTKTKIQD